MATTTSRMGSFYDEKRAGLLFAGMWLPLDVAAQREATPAD